MKADDLLPEFLYWLGQVDAKRAESLVKEYDLDSIDETDEGYDETAQEAVDALFDILGEYCPPYCYFGAHEGDGADYGVWISWDSLDMAAHDGDILKVSDTSEVPADYTGEVLHVNDHGNCTLYAANNGDLTEVWAVV
jgi:hypothetical protein